MDLATELADQPFGATTSPWDGHERAIGYGVMVLPMSRGHLLGLRVFPRTDFGGYVSVWHRDADGDWAQYVDLAPVEAGCPRVWGPALSHADAASIDVSWTGPDELEVRMDRPELRWWLRFARTWPLAVLNAISARLPLATWRPRWLVATREVVARVLGLGPVSLSGQAPTEEHLTAALERLYWVEDSTATLDGEDLGRPVVLPACPRIGDWPLPRRGVLAVGEAHATIGDRAGYERLRQATA